MDNKTLYKPFPYKGKGNKKMSVYVKNDKGGKKLIHFGDANMQDFRQHKDEKRRKSYLARSGGIRNKAGKLTANDKNSANYWSRKVLWNA